LNALPGARYPETPAPINKINMKITADQLLNKAKTLLQQRAEQYDCPTGERSIKAAVQAFNAITGKSLTEAHGCLFMALLKMAQDNQRIEPHQDSCEGLVSYAALYGEARMGNNPCK
jgi:hypothetical protein